MAGLILFGILSIPLIWLSRGTLLNPQSHGFCRFFSWECILWLLVSNIPHWFDDPLSAPQLFSWILLFISLYLVIAGVILLKQRGKPGQKRDDKALYPFERTARLVETGIYKYIRHPLYASLIFLTWGIFLKQMTLTLLLISLLSTLFLVLTARADEKECIEYFGNSYKEYMKRTTRFIPFIF